MKGIIKAAFLCTFLWIIASTIEIIINQNNMDLLWFITGSIYAFTVDELEWVK